jgi:hypothetical protein
MTSQTQSSATAWLLTDEEMAEVQGDKDACLAVISGFGSCGGCCDKCWQQLKKEAGRNNGN